MTRFLLLVAFTLVALAMGTRALQCTEVNKCNACLDAIDDSGSPCRWCESAGGCVRQGFPCTTPSQCSDGGDGGGGSSGLSGGETAGVVIGVLVAACCCCLCIAVVVAVTVTVVVYVVRRSSSNSGA